jgi:hypothetical protein
MPVLREISRVWVSEGGLEPPRRWYIPEPGIYHHSKVARRRCPARQFAMGASGSWQSSLPGPEPWENGGPRRARRLKRTTRKAAVLRHRPRCAAPPGPRQLWHDLPCIRLRRAWTRRLLARIGACEDGGRAVVSRRSRHWRWSGWPVLLAALSGLHSQSERRLGAHRRPRYQVQPAPLRAGSGVAVHGAIPGAAVAALFLLTTEIPCGHRPARLGVIQRGCLRPAT